MAYKLGAGDRRIKDDISLLVDGLQCYDDIADPNFDMSMDELLHERSAFEFVRDQLSDEQRLELDVVDSYWKAHASDFNDTFARWHRLSPEAKKNEMVGFIQDENGAVPSIGRSHWWWWPIEGDDA